MRPKKEDCPEYYNYYIGLIKQQDVVSALTETKKETLDFIKSIPSALENYAYADKKWTVKEVLIHCIDTERIFSTRALSFARGDKQIPHSYDENIYGTNSHAASRTLKDILEEFEAVRIGVICLYRSFSTEVLNISGQTPSGPAAVNAIGFTICGHTVHHLGIIKERYLQTIKK
ncbi:MAG: DinB family protein [Bacteroidetes bacterium]|nr:DinB family protein [Bacteroidota bacterium]